MVARSLSLGFLAVLILAALLSLGPQASQAYAGRAAPKPEAQLTASEVIGPEDDLQAAVDSNPAGTTFVLSPGVHRMREVIPKDGSTFIGEPGAVMSGAKVITDFARAGTHWVAEPQLAERPQIHGECAAEHPGCKYSQDLFIDNVMWERVTSRSEVVSGRWYMDLDEGRLYIADNPEGHQVELSVTEHAFYGDAAGVRIQGLVIEKYANRAQDGAIHGKDNLAKSLGSDWVVEGNDIRFNHGGGIRLGERMQVLNNRIHHNGQIGIIGGEAEGILVQGNEIAYNNTAGFDASWEAGGTKFVNTRGLIVRSNHVHDNKGPGLWTDINNIETLYEDNLVENNESMGIFHEISYEAVIRNNTVRNNGSTDERWLWGAGILVANSRNVEIYGNVVAGNANGIAAIQQDRGEGKYGPLEVTNLRVHDNVVTMALGQTGLAQDVGDDSYFSERGNRFERNTYFLGAAKTYFAWLNAARTKEEWVAFGNDTEGEWHQEDRPDERQEDSSRSDVLLAAAGIVLAAATVLVVAVRVKRPSPPHLPRGR